MWRLGDKLGACPEPPRRPNAWPVRHSFVGTGSAVSSAYVGVAALVSDGALPAQGSRRGSPNFAMTLLSKRVIARIRSPASVMTSIPVA